MQNSYTQHWLIYLYIFSTIVIEYSGIKINGICWCYFFSFSFYPFIGKNDSKKSHKFVAFFEKKTEKWELREEEGKKTTNLFMSHPIYMNVKDQCKQTINFKVKRLKLRELEKNVQKKEKMEWKLIKLEENGNLGFKFE